MGGFDLDPPEVVSGVDDKVVALALSPGFGYTESQVGGFGQKCRLCHFPGTFVLVEGDSLDLEQFFSVGFK